MGLIFNRTPKDEPECLGMHVVNGTLSKCCDLSRRKNPLPDIVPEPAREKTQRVVILVHGTFAKHAPWMQDKPKNEAEGMLCKELRGIEGTLLRRFCWSGSNSHSARLQAGDDLARYLRNLKSEFPHARHFVIAHSHGGNVAMYAMESNSSDGKKHDGEGIAGVITLATPFITLRKRQLPRFVIPSALFALAFIFVVCAVVQVKPPAKPPNWATIKLLSTLFGVWFTGTAVSAWLFHRPNFNFGTLWRMFRDRNKAEQQDLDNQLRAFQPHSLSSDKVLVMRPLGDEANMSLVVSQSLSWMQNKILSFLQGFQDGFLGRPGASAVSETNSEGAKPKRRSGCLMSMLKLVGLIGLFIGVAVVAVQNSAEEHAIATIYGTIDEAMPGSWLQKLPLLIPMILFASLLFFFLVFGFVSLYALIGLLLSAAPFGLDAMFWNHFTSTTAEPAPVGKSPAHIFHAAPKDGFVDAGLAHSGIYTNPDAIAQIVSWITNR